MARSVVEKVKHRLICGRHRRRVREHLQRHNAVQKVVKTQATRVIDRSSYRPNKAKHKNGFNVVLDDISLVIYVNRDVVGVKQRCELSDRC